MGFHGRCGDCRDNRAGRKTKRHLGTHPVGFDHWEILPGQGSYWNPDFIQMDGTTKRFEGYVTDIITDKALDWLEGRADKDKPFLLMAQHKAPHRNWMPAERHLMMFEGIDLPETETLFDDYANRSEALKKQAMIKIPTNNAATRTPPTWRF